MSTYNTHYTGGEPSYFPTPTKKNKTSSPSLARPLITSLILAIALTGAALRWLWPTTPTNLASGQIPARKTSRPVAHLAGATIDPLSPGGPRQRRAVGVEDMSERSQTGRLQIPLDPQVQEIIFNNPSLLPPFPTENNLKVGTPRARLVGAFGRPDLSARTMHQERLIEIYVYEQPDRSTFVLMQDGKAVSAYTGKTQRARVLASESEPDL